MVGEAHSLENAFRAASRTNECLKIRDCSVYNIKCRQLFFFVFFLPAHPSVAASRRLIRASGPCLYTIVTRGYLSIYIYYINILVIGILYSVPIGCVKFYFKNALHEKFKRYHILHCNNIMQVTTQGVAVIWETKSL